MIIIIDRFLFTHYYLIFNLTSTLLSNIINYVIDYKKIMKKVIHMSDEVFLFEEIEEIVAPTDGEFWGGVIIGAGVVLLIGAACC